LFDGLNFKILSTTQNWKALHINGIITITIINLTFSLENGDINLFPIFSNTELNDF